MTKLLFMVLAVPAFSWANGTMELKGTVVNFDSKTIEISDTHYVFTLKKALIKNTVLKSLKVGQEADFWVASEGIVAAKEIPATKK